MVLKGGVLFLYSTLDGTKRKLTDELWDETEIDDRIEATDPDVISWINSAVNRSVDFTEDELIGTESVIRLAADCYNACRIMSEQLEGHNIDQQSLAVFRCNEARDLIRQWCAQNGIVATFDDVSAADSGVSTEVGASFAYAIGEDSVCIG